MGTFTCALNGLTVTRACPSLLLAVHVAVIAATGLRKELVVLLPSLQGPALGVVLLGAVGIPELGHLPQLVLQEVGVQQ
jgi:hypothetical protein